MTEIKLVLEFGECNGYMTAEVYVNNILLELPGLNDQKKLTINTKAIFPLNLQIRVSGKNMDTDTKVVNGKIVEDKYVKLAELYLSRYPVNTFILREFCLFSPDNGPDSYSDYFFTNGTAQLDFKTNDALQWHLLHNKY